MKRLLALLSLTAGGAFAQCVMCYRTAEAQNAQRAKVLNAGIVIMLIPPVLILAGFMWLAWKRSRTYSQPEPLDAEAQRRREAA